MATIIRENGAGIASFHHVFPGADGDIVNTMGFTTQSGDGDQISAKLQAAWRLTLLLSMSSLARFVKCNVLVQISGQLESWDNFAPANSFGGSGGDQLPTNVAILIQKRTGLAGRRHRGRLFLGGVPLSFVNTNGVPNALKAATLVEVQTNADNFLTSMLSSEGGGACTPLVLHPTPHPQGTVITALSVQAQLATQRGRLRG